jgi:hypothetical protein
MNFERPTKSWSRNNGVYDFKSALFWDITQRRVVILYGSFCTTYRSHQQGSKGSRRTLSTYCIPTHYGLEVSGMESEWGRNSPQSFRPALELTQLSLRLTGSLFRG